MCVCVCVCVYVVLASGMLAWGARGAGAAAKGRAYDSYRQGRYEARFGLYKILFYFEA